MLRVLWNPVVEMRSIHSSVVPQKDLSNTRTHLLSSPMPRPAMALRFLEGSVGVNLIVLALSTPSGTVTMTALLAVYVFELLVVTLTLGLL